LPELAANVTDVTRPRPSIRNETRATPCAETRGRPAREIQRILNGGDAAFLDVFGGDHAERATTKILLNWRQTTPEDERTKIKQFLCCSRGAGEHGGGGQSRR